MSDITFNISGGNNQILPNATKAEQNFYGDKYVEEHINRDKAGITSSPDVSRLRTYINNVEALAGYVARLAGCKTAKELGVIVVDMAYDPRVLLDKDIMVKKEFIDVIRPLTPQVTCGPDNIYKYISAASYARKDQLRQQKLAQQHGNNR